MNILLQEIMPDCLPKCLYFFQQLNFFSVVHTSWVLVKKKKIVSELVQCYAKHSVGSWVLDGL